MLDFLYIPVSWVLLQWHHLFTHLGLSAASGVNWALSIVFLVITARVLLFRLFIRQIKYQRQMAILQPQIKELQKKYKDDKQEQQRQIMALQQEHGFNPLSGCLPLLLQWPIFIALFHVLRHMSNSVALCKAWKLGAPPSGHLSLYTFTNQETCDAATARLFGKAPLAARLTETTKLLTQLHGQRGVLTVTVLVLVLISSGATYMTQRLARKANPVQPEGQAAMIANMMQYLIPIGTLGSGLFFPLGVLLYWFTSNTWTMVQQLYVNKYHPHEATQAPTHDVGKTLAPPPGRRPVRPNRGAASGAEQPIIVDGADGGAAIEGGPSADVPRSSPPPGKKPVRPAGNRPSNNRRSPSKKRR